MGGGGKGPIDGVVCVLPPLPNNIEGDPAKGEPVISKVGEGVVVTAFFLPLSLLTGPKPVCKGSVAIVFVSVCV